MNKGINTETLRTALVGYGRMGQVLERLSPQQGIDIVRRYDSTNRLSDDDDPAFDVAVEFTNPDAVIDNIRILAQLGKPIVVGTTGWADRMEEVRQIIGAHNARLVHASNFSIGVNIFFRIVDEAARLVNAQQMYDVAVHEIHHTGKADSPSGTALAIAHILLDGLDSKSTLLTETSHRRIAPDQLHVTSQRLGSIGTHSVTFNSTVDTIELVHRAENRDGFALGALVAARWIVSQPPGIYRFEDLF